MNNHVAYNCGGASGTTTVAAGGCSELSGNPSDKVGGGVNAALQLQRADRRQRRTVHRRYVVEGRDARTSSPTSVRARRSLSTAVRTALATYGSITGSLLFDSVYTTTTRTGCGHHGWPDRPAADDGLRRLDCLRARLERRMADLGVRWRAGGRLQRHSQRDPVLEVCRRPHQRGWCQRPQHRTPVTGTTASSARAPGPTGPRFAT